MSRFVAWIDNKVVGIKNADELTHDIFVIDTQYKHVSERYGKYLKSHGWQHIPFSEFPPEFKAHLLLLGVS